MNVGKGTFTRGLRLASSLSAHAHFPGPARLASEMTAFGMILLLANELDPGNKAEEHGRSGLVEPAFRSVAGRRGEGGSSGSQSLFSGESSAPPAGSPLLTNPGRSWVPGNPR